MQRIAYISYSPYQIEIGAKYPRSMKLKDDGKGNKLWSHRKYPSRIVKLAGDMAMVVTRSRGKEISYGESDITYRVYKKSNRTLILMISVYHSNYKGYKSHLSHYLNSNDRGRYNTVVVKAHDALFRRRSNPNIYAWSHFVGNVLKGTMTIFRTFIVDIEGTKKVKKDFFLHHSGLIVKGK